MPTPILFIDDEPYYAHPLVESLEKAGYKVVLKEDAASGLAYLQTNAGSLGLVILDYMMPTPEGFLEAETLDGLATGRWFLRSAWGLIESHDLPILVLTNRNVEMVRAELSDFDSEKAQKLLCIRHKTSMLRSSIPEHVKTMLR